MAVEMNGYIKIDRKILNNPLWTEKPFSKGQAWVDLIGLANWKDSEVLVGYETVIVHRGEVARSQLWLADRWGWSAKKVRAFLGYLEREGALTKKGTTKGTTLTIENYNKYQGEGRTEDPTDAQRKTLMMPIKCPHIKKNNKENKEKKYIQREIKEKDDIMGIAHAQFAEIKERLRNGQV